MAKTLLFITSNRLGDAVLSTGLLQAALQRFAPDAVTVACGPIPAPLFQGVPKLEEIIILDKKRRGAHWLDLWKRCARRKWDVVIDLRHSLVSYFIPAKQVFRFTRADKNKHKTEQLAAVLKLSPVPPNKIWITEEAKKKALGLMGSGRILALCPTAAWQGKRWPPEKFIEAALRLTAQGERIAVFAAADEAAQAQALIETLKKSREVIDLVGETDVLEAAACLAYCRLCLANDSGLMHLAAAMRVPTLGLFGPSSDVEYRPWGPNAAFVRGAPFKGMQNTRDPQALMQALSVEHVIAAAQKLLA
ncbi:MAG TPA: glycosyltransferase family 9 protein [Alphaproteobacteria bacterium]|nr:glycosyltransferase family 9 protein [Alphaproteobacteria bacterium]